MNTQAAAIYRVVKFWDLYSAREQSLSEPHGAATFRNISDYVVSDNQVQEGTPKSKTREILLPPNTVSTRSFEYYSQYYFRVSFSKRKQKCNTYKVLPPG